MLRHRLVLLLLVVFPLILPAAARQAPSARVIDLKAPDGTVLKATYFAAAKAGPGVLLLHQCNRQRKVWDDLVAGQLAAAGINVLTFDLRGFGESGGTPFDKLTPQENAQVQAEKWPGDIDTAFQYLVSQPGVTRDVIGVGGASCGVNNSIQTALRHPGVVKSLVLLSGGTGLAGRRFLRQEPPPALFAMADDDEFRDTVEVMPWLFSVASNPGKKFVRYAKGGHGADMFAVHPELRGVIVDWYVTTLITTPGRAPADKSAGPASPSAQILDQIDMPGGAEKAARKLAEARRNDPKAVSFPETIVNLMGYEHLQAGDIKEALEIMKLNATAFPESPNAYDSLSDAYLADGQKELARQNAKKALELLASDTTDPQARRNAIRDNAQLKLKQLGAAQP